MPLYNFSINVDEASTLIVLGGLMMTGIQNLVFSIYLVAIFKKGLDVFKMVMNVSILINAVMFAMFLFPFGNWCGLLGTVGNSACHVFLICIDLLLLLRVLTLVPKSFADRLIVAVLFFNRLAAGFSDVLMSPSSPLDDQSCRYHANVVTGWWYLGSDTAIDVYVTVRNFMILREAESLVGSVPFFSIYRNWNVSRSAIILMLNVTTGLFSMLTFKVDHSLYIMVATLQFMILSYIMTYDMTFMKTAEAKQLSSISKSRPDSIQSPLASQRPTVSIDP
ncbi:hypothetical protein HDU97_002404 [Phlyctochytrium planicorne]|nr:hypothetical protein HDU97_002404 [Phlyctochytrium planicorne]